MFLDTAQAARHGDLAINFAEKEAYLTPADFATIFKMSKVDFDKLPKWKKAAIKKDVGLF